MKTPLKTPVAFIIFNRPKCTRRVFERIRDARPEKLYLIADAPRPNKDGEAEKCAETRRIVEEMIDWPCEVHKNYADANMGCGKRIPSGLDWVFENEAEAIIMEDDILADPSFFLFCSELLQRYRDNGTVMQIGGYNRFNYNPHDSSYFYSRFCDIWGWATWRHEWDKFKAVDHVEWDRIKRDNLLSVLCMTTKEAEMRTFVLDDIFSGKLSAWGMRWELTKLINKGLGVVPSRNLIKNIGFGMDASHTINPINRNQLMRPHRLLPPYDAPASMISNAEYETRFLKAMFPNVYLEKLRTVLQRVLFRK
jgi:hypothetical protein